MSIYASNLISVCRIFFLKARKEKITGFIIVIKTIAEVAVNLVCAVRGTVCSMQQEVITKNIQVVESRYSPIIVPTMRATPLRSPTLLFSVMPSSGDSSWLSSAIFKGSSDRALPVEWDIGIRFVPFTSLTEKTEKRKISSHLHK